MRDNKLRDANANMSPPLRAAAGPPASRGAWRGGGGPGGGLRAPEAPGLLPERRAHPGEEGEGPGEGESGR